MDIYRTSNIKENRREIEALLFSKALQTFDNNK